MKHWKLTQYDVQLTSEDIILLNFNSVNIKLTRKKCNAFLIIAAEMIVPKYWNQPRAPSSRERVEEISMIKSFERK